MDITMLTTSDIISLHTPLTEDNYHMIGENELHQMKQNAILINTARGGLIDEDALARVLAENRIAGAGLDCLEMAQPAPQHPFVQDPRVVITPHIGGSTSDIADIMVPAIANTILQLERGAQIDTVVNRQYLQVSV